MSRLLKELRSLTPFGWDKQLEQHRAGPAMLRDWEKVRLQESPERVCFD